MSYADEVFIQNCKKILAEGFSDENYDVRPHWSDGVPAHTIKCFGIVNRCIEGGHEKVDVETVGCSTLLNVLEMSGGAADAAHAAVHESFDSLRVLLNNFEDTHIFGDFCHFIFLLVDICKLTSRDYIIYFGIKKEVLKGEELTGSIYKAVH